LISRFQFPHPCRIPASSYIPLIRWSIHVVLFPHIVVYAHP
jgi:hypothetical protein